jgi:polyisoprenoid-binding protein YceI
MNLILSARNFVIAAILMIVLGTSFNLKAVAPSDSGTLQYSVDPKQSQFMAHTGSGGVFGAFGHKHDIAIQDFSGEVQFSSEKPELSSLQLAIKADSLVVTEKVSEKDKLQIEHDMREKVLETNRFPEITFKGTAVSAIKAANGIYDVKIMGTLSLHGVSHEIPLNAQVSLEENRLTAKGVFLVKQTDYQIKPISVGGGAIKVKNEVKLTFDIVAHP